jgi:hypothetical protein
MRRCSNLVVLAAAMSFSAPAFAAGNCPPGAWFCAEADVNVPAPVQPQAPKIPPQVVAPAPAAEEPVEPTPAAPPQPVRRRVAPPMPGVAPPPVVIYQPVPTAPPPQVIVVTPGYGYGYRYTPPRPPVIHTAPPAPRWRSEFGINLRVEGMGINKPGHGVFNAGLGGVGLSLRYRPVPHFAFDLGVDVLAGTDYNGFQRTEVPVSLSALLYVNPRSRVQFYLLAGGNVSRAEVRSDLPATQLHAVDGGAQYGESYTYVGGQGGGGLEFRLSRRVALGLDTIGFIRKRIDDSGKPPEFIETQANGNQRSTNVSGGVLFRGGLTFWW